MADNDYANPDVLVDTLWVAAHVDDPRVRLVESSGNGTLYEQGHIPGAVHLDCRADLQNQIVRDFLTKDEFESLMESHGIANDTTVVFYGDRDNLYAAYAYWMFKMYGHQDCRILNGGRAKWETEGREVSRETPVYPRGNYRAQAGDLSIRAFRDQVLAQIYAGKPLVDVRSPEEYAGAAGFQADDARRGGFIPTATNAPWTLAAGADGSFKDAAELRSIYQALDVRPDQPVITYSHTGARSAHSWFVLSQLLGYPDVRNYDGSWSEWGNLVRAPIEQADSATECRPGEKADDWAR